ncbi:MAG TPA: ATP-binding protein [Candidatus Polarisedimenticolia bacterium]
MRLRHRLLLSLASFVLVATLAIDLTASILIDRAVADRAVERLRAESELLARRLEAALPASIREADAWADEAGAALGLRVTLIDPGGKVLGDSQVPPGEIPSMENHLHRPEVIEAATSGSGVATRLSASVGRDMQYLARRIGPPGSPRGFVRLAIPSADLSAVSRRYRLLLTSASLASLALLAGIAYATVRRFSAPIERLSRAADRVASGDYGVTIEHDSRDEVGDLVASIDRMRRGLIDQIGRADAERRLLASILGGLREGILVVGPDREVVLTNPAFRATMGIRREVAEGTPLFEVVRDHTIMEAYDDALDHQTDVARRISIPGGRTYELTVVPLSGGAGAPAGAVGLFFEVTRLEALEKVRRDFVADISHELRTPLASLKAALETLMGGALAEPDDAGRFLDIVTKNVERMEAILNDLTDLSLIETGAIVLSTGPIDLQTAVREAVASLTLRANLNHVGFEVRVEPLRVLADRRRLDQILTNLLDNAVKFNKPGGSVIVSARQEPHTVILTVEDTGPGIPPDALDRVFNRFYRLDRSRSRDLPGTGLGLAIVKHLVRLQGGLILAENRDEGGARFVLELPAAG